MRADSFAFRRLAHKGINVFKENYSYSLLSCWRIALYLQVILFAPSYFDGNISLQIWDSLMLYTAAGGLLVCFIGRLCSPMACSMPYKIAAGSLGTVGMLAIALAATGIAGREALEIGCALSCISFAATTALWLQRFISQGLDSVAWNYLVGILVGTTLYFVVESMLGEASLFLFATFPTIACLTVRKPQPNTASSADEITGILAASEREHGETSSFGTYRLLIVLLIVCVAFGLLAQQAFTPITSLPKEFFAFLVSVDVVVCFIAKVIASFAHAKRSLIVFYLIIPFVCISTMGMTACESQTGNIAFYCAGQIAFQLTSFMTVFKISETFREKTNDVAPYIGAIIIMQHAGQFAGRTIGSAIPSDSTITIVVLAAMVAVSLIIMGNTTSFTLTNPKKVNSKLDAIHTISRECKLTPREIDILELWGMGHTSNYIEEQLYIAKSTVKTHLSHIYQKTGTESKEDLLQLIDEKAAGVATTGK